MRVFLVGLVGLAVVLYGLMTQQATPVTFGVTFSPRYAKYLKLDWQNVFKEMLDETKVKNLRLPLYWEDIEPEPDLFNFAGAEFMLSLSEQKGAKVIMVLGMRQPRWPECHLPDWARQLSVSERQEKLLQLIRKSVERLDASPAVWAWQVENEPLLPFGEGCDRPDVNFLKKEVELVRSLSRKPIIMTDSGELGFWMMSMQLSDIFGTTLYRQVYDKSLGYITYPLPAFFYKFKSDLIRNIFAESNQKTIIIESQAEPWLADGKFPGAPEQAKLFTPDQFKSYVDYARKAGFDEVYLWGAEWWYFMAENGHPEYLNYAKSLFNN